MPYPAAHRQELSINGFTIVDKVYSTDELTAIIEEINKAGRASATFRKTADLFAIRQFLKEIPAVKPLLFSSRLRQIVNGLIGEDFFIVKSIYFDKPPLSNWFVAWHQDLTISVGKRIEQPGYTNWTLKQNQFAVQSPVNVLENVVTIRIHLDDTDANNGALRVIPGSHLQGITRPETITDASYQAISCDVNAGGVMLMRPLLLHSSNRTVNNERRRVVHLEFSNKPLSEQLNWAEA